MISVNGSPFSGDGLFRFAIIDAATALNFWTNDGTNLGGSGAPSEAVLHSVTNEVSAAMLREARDKGSESRFHRPDRGLFVINDVSAESMTATRERIETFDVEDGYLIRKVVPRRGEPYEHHCPKRRSSW